MDPIMETLQEIFTIHFDVEETAISDQTSAQDVEGWDSFAHVSLMSDVEERFNVSFTGSEIVAFKTVGDIVDTIRRKVA